MPVRAVVFDLWDTIVEFRPDEGEALHRRIAERLGVPYERFHEVWYTDDAIRSRNIGPIAPCFSAACETLGVEADVDELVGWRRELTRRALVPREGLLDTLTGLRTRGLRVGLVSNCTEEVADVWPETNFADLFDSTVFSATAGHAKPGPEIYRIAVEELSVEPSECLFVGDGANDELRGAQDVGMTPVLIHRDGEEPHWESVRGWSGFRITAIPQVLDLVP
ncbi:MAG: HAD family hydrolase [Gaiellaceae bacterium]